MHTSRLVRHFFRLGSMTAFFVGLSPAVASCGSNSGSSTFTADDGSVDSSTGSDDGSVGSTGTSSGGFAGGSDSGTPDAAGRLCHTCTDLGYTCGMNGDGCGHVLDCGSCTTPAYCGGAGFSKCGTGSTTTADGAPVCTPVTACPAGQNCGSIGDGCGGLVQCGSGAGCTAPDFCGGGGFNVCGSIAGFDGGSSCMAASCNSLGYTCGAAGDGCGGSLDCGDTCPGTQFCGGGGFNKCGGSTTGDSGAGCVSATCKSLGYTCGYASDGCGNLLDCGGPTACTAPQFCGGGGFDVCGPSGTNGCDGGSSTSLTGFVYDPGDNLPIYNALVYIPVGTVQTPKTGVDINSPSCACDAPPAYASAFTDISGKFTLQNIPSNLTSAQVVVQLGKWQRVFTEALTPCGSKTLTTHLTLPSKHSQGNIPLFAVDTGAVDAMECVLLKMGIDPGEFVDPAVTGGVPTAAGRVQFYKGASQGAGVPAKNPVGGQVISRNTPGEAVLTETASVMDSYDVILFPCKGGGPMESADGTIGYNTADGFPNTWTNLLNYTAAGGRAFTTHFHYDLLDGNGSFSGTANWALNGPQTAGPDTGTILDTTLAQWLNQRSVYGGTLGQIPVSAIRNDFSSVNAPAELWMTMTTGTGKNASTFPIHYTFDTPFNQSPTCGRVVYSDFHVEDRQNNPTNTSTFPNGCTTGGLTPQEKLLEFMLFDLTSCVSPPTCTPLTCADYPAGTCGKQGDGCGGSTDDCLACTPPQTCGGAGVVGQCGGGSTCAGLTCTQQNIGCGPAGDGCGNPLDCGKCKAPQTCGGGGMPGQCGGLVGCTSKSCTDQGIGCGPAGDGCGNQLDCGSCTSPQTCGGAGVPGQCGGGGVCSPKTCADQNVTCGPAGDGCGNLLQCGTCVAPATCGGAGVSGQCGNPGMVQ